MRSIAALSASRPRSTSRPYRSTPRRRVGKSTSSTPTTTRLRGFARCCRPSCSSLNPNRHRGTHHGQSSRHQFPARPSYRARLSCRPRRLDPRPDRDAGRAGVGCGSPGVEPRSRPATRSRGDAPRPGRRTRDRSARPPPPVGSRAAGNRPQRRGARLTRRDDPAVDATHARRRNRRDQADRSRPGGNTLARGHRSNVPVRDVSPLGLLARRRRCRVHARRRPELAGAPAWPRLQSGDGDRGRHRRRRGHAGNAVRAHGPVLGAARWRRQFRRGDRVGIHALPLSRGLRRHVPVALRTSPRGPRVVVRVDP